MSKNTEDPTLEAVRLLRESGYHEAAADLATKALQRVTATTPAVPSESTSESTVRPTAAPSLTHAPTTEAEQRAEGAYVLAAMHRQFGWSPAVGAGDDEAA